MGSFDSRVILLAPEDNCVAVAATLAAGTRLLIDGAMVLIERDIGIGHKLARRDIAPGEKILKYGAIIGSATRPIARGAHIHLHNLASDYLPTYTLPPAG
ncbi:MAG: hydrolase [Betaproteobacteria bacterium]|nr:hydrolase [Betaproteobacteria bacterium]